MKSQQLRCLLKNFYSSLNSYLYNHQGNHSEKILHELELIKLDSIEKINASKSATCSELNNTLRNIPVKLAPLDTIVEKISNLVIWYEASRGVPDLFKGGYAFAEIIGKRGLMVSNHIRLGLYIQKPEINYPLHAHDAEESYLILSGNTDWQRIKNLGLVQVVLFITIPVKHMAHILTRNLYLRYGFGRDRLMGVTGSQVILGNLFHYDLRTSSEKGGGSL